MRFSGCTNTTAGLTIEFCKRLPPLTAEQFTRDLGGSFRAVRDTLAHIFKGEWI
jgi:uncharacterized damage-inducible protein DinB